MGISICSWRLETLCMPLRCTKEAARQKARGKRQKAKGRYFFPSLLPLAFCLLPFALFSLAACGKQGPPYLVYVSNEASGDITVIDPVKLEAIATVPLGKRPRGIHATADGKLIYVTMSGSAFAPPGTDESKLPPPDRSADGIAVLDPSDDKMVRKLPAGIDPEQFALRHDGKMLYISNEDDAG